MDSFIFSILLKEQQNSLKTNQGKGVWQRVDEMLRQVNPFAELCNEYIK
jgi:hypothetical protein